jgi:hypothetical protein
LSLIAEIGATHGVVADDVPAGPPMTMHPDIVADRHGLEQSRILKRPPDPETDNAMTRVPTLRGEKIRQNSADAGKRP